MYLKLNLRPCGTHGWIKLIQLYLKNILSWSIIKSEHLWVCTKSMHRHIPISLVIPQKIVNSFWNNIWVFIIKEKIPSLFFTLCNSYEFLEMNYPILSECVESKYIGVVILVLFFLSGLMRKTGQKDTDHSSQVDYLAQMIHGKNYSITFYCIFWYGMGT